MQQPNSAADFVTNLEGRYYADAALHEIEREKIFRRTWQLVGPTSHLVDQNAYLATAIAGYQIFAQRGRDGVLRAFENVCPHRGARILAPGHGQCDQLQCPYHAWIFGQDGRVTDTPWFGEASPFDREALHLPAIGVAEWRGLVFAAIDPETTLIEQLGDLPGEAETAPMERFALETERCFTADVNWKAYLDQFNEFYHAPAVHAADKTVGIDRYDVYPLHNMMRMTSPQGDGSDAAYYGGKWLWGWPNWTISFFPGGMKTSRVDPLSATRCQVHFAYYFEDRSPATESARAHVVTATEDIFREDVGCAQLVQLNYASGAYRPGPLHPRLERAVAYFQARVRDTVEGGTDAAALLPQRITRQET